jgi:tRNA pseudouridine13 synthase
MTESFAWGGPVARGVIRHEPEDFEVEEILGFDPDGEGEHLWLWIEKINQNTAYVAEQLARLAGISARNVSFAGLKDRNARTRQYFSLHLPGQPDPEWQNWDTQGFSILRGQRSSRKIQRGRLQGNLFKLLIRDLQFQDTHDLSKPNHGCPSLLEQRLECLKEQGMPNFFGEQRFGGNNVGRAKRLFAGELRGKRSKPKRGFYLSAARSLIFNQVLEERLKQGTWDQIIDGDLLMLDGSRSWFVPKDQDNPASLMSRCQALDLHPTGPLVGEQPSAASGEAAIIEEMVCGQHPDLIEGLVQFRLQTQRRPLRARIHDLRWSWPESTQLELKFRLDSGSYATTLLRELIEYPL